MSTKFLLFFIMFHSLCPVSFQNTSLLYEVTTFNKASFCTKNTKFSTYWIGLVGFSLIGKIALTSNFIPSQLFFWLLAFVFIGMLCLFKHPLRICRSNFSYSQQFAPIRRNIRQLSKLPLTATWLFTHKSDALLSAEFKLRLNQLNSGWKSS